MSALAKLSDFEERAEQAVKDVNLGMERFAVELKQIKDLGLWKGSYDSFEDYCNTRWGRTVRTVQRALKVHTTRQKLLAAASSDEKTVIEASSTRKIEEVAKAPEDQQMAHLTIGRNKPKATKLVDFYSSGPVDDDAKRAELLDVEIQKAARIGAAMLLRTYPLKDEAHRTYLNHLANCIEKGEPA